ncbi:p49 [Mamestra brassicae multiple nucleopolyhedrovirus]|uniref:p49 n=1 Tax=Mamestra brassicae nuclear polyhedrosis virus TaxID=78219 RepID=I3XMH5_NPVMB|nr:p49 [Mamestra brassicae multiple nucleopolyhedrovirus]AFL65008.1 p49 [Mamestra brassicae multiple nucleopolyhedrovirus]WRQ96731.1 maco-B 166 [Mamestra configurata nucleopolyhedrovirus B]WRQ96892.1 maco-B 166 [Mamestra configurata nucleopolyhedrovirus B]WRQ97053.1 macoB166 [Mamestra configurata nucleopolyhedrovirus B]
MSLVNNKHALQNKQLKYLFLATYFDLKNFDRIPSEVRPFIQEYLRNNFQNIEDSTLLSYINYLNEISLKHLIVDKDVNVFKYIKPQFKFTCMRDSVDIIEFEKRVYIQPGTPVYATNFFVNDPQPFLLFFYNEFTKVFNQRLFVQNNTNFTLIEGREGYLFDNAYVDWSGVQMCEMPKVSSPNYPYRLYLIGEPMAQHFLRNNIINELTGDFLLRNFYKGLPLTHNNYAIINSKHFSTRKPNKVFEEINLELDTSTNYIKFIQRDYIYDAKFPDDLLELLNDYITLTSYYKFIMKFNDLNQKMYSSYNEIIVDRYAVNKYRKLNIKTEVNSILPTLRNNETSCIFVHPDIIQIKGTLNAFYVPSSQLFIILASNSLFGSTKLLYFDYRLIPYRQFSSPHVINRDTYIVDAKHKIYLTKHIFGTSVPAYLIIRGDYESSQFKTLDNLKNPWVKNTLLTLFVP